MAGLRTRGSVPEVAFGTGWNIRGGQVWKLREPLRSYIVTVSVLAAAVIGVAAAMVPLRAGQVAIFVALVGCGVISIESTRSVKEVHGAIVRDLQPVWYLAIAVNLPPAYALAAPVPLVAYKLWRQPGLIPYRRIFSNATISLAYGCASWLFHRFPASAAGHAPGSGTHVITWAGITAACGVIAWVVNNGFLVVAIRLADEGASIRDLIGNRDAATSDLIDVTLGVSLALVVAINPVLMALALPSVLLYRRTLMQAQLVAQSRMDSSTGVLNAGTWRREAEAEFLRAAAGRRPLALVMAGIDHLDSVTETAGPEAGDQVLRGIARTLTDTLPGHGLVGRFGGEEFAILLPGTGEEDARRLAERLRDHVAGEPVAIENGGHAGFVFRLTVSIGIAVADHSRRALTGQMMTELIGAAGVALREAKATGHNRVCVMTPDAA